MALPVALELDDGQFIVEIDQATLPAALPQDLAADWLAAEAEWRSAADTAQRAVALARQVRAALVSAAITSRAEQLPAPLRAALVAKGQWTTERALADLCRLEPFGKADAYAWLLPHLDTAQRDVAAHYNIDGLLAPDRCAYVEHEQWMRALPALSTEQLSYAVAGMRQLTDHSYRTALLVAALPFLPDALVPEALGLAAQTEAGDDRARLVMGAVDRLAPELLPAALRIVRTVDWPYWRVKALSTLLPYVASAQRAGIVAECLALATADPNPQLAALAAQHVPAPQGRELLAAAIDLAGSYPSHWTRMQALRGLVPYLSAPEAAHLAPAVLRAALELEHAHERLPVLRPLLPLLPAPLRSEALAEALRCARATSGYEGAPALAELADLLPEPERSVVLAEAWQIIRTLDNDEGYQADTLARIAAYLPEPVLAEAVAYAARHSYKWDRTRLIQALAPALPAHLLAPALAAVRPIDDGWERRRVYETLLGHGATVKPEPDNADLWWEWDGSVVDPIEPDVDEWAAYISDVEALTEALLPRIGTMTPPELQQTLDWVGTLEVGPSQIELLTALEPRLSEAQLLQGIAAVASPLNTRWNGEAIERLAPRIPAALVPHVLTLIERFEYTHERDVAWGGLIPRLIALGQDTMADELLDRIEDAGEKLRAHAARAAYLPPEHKAGALDAVLDGLAANPVAGICDRVLPVWAAQCATLPIGDAHALWCRALRRLARAERAQLLRNLGALAPLLSALGGVAALDAVAVAVADVAAWLP